MTSKEAFDIIIAYVPPCFKKELETIEKDLDILEDFIKLFEGEDLDGWIEFNFNYTREPEDSIDNYNGFVSLLKRIRSYLEGVQNGNTSKEETKA